LANLDGISLDLVLLQSSLGETWKPLHQPSINWWRTNRRGAPSGKCDRLLHGCSLQVALCGLHSQAAGAPHFPDLGAQISLSSGRGHENSSLLKHFAMLSLRNSFSSSSDSAQLGFLVVSLAEWQLLGARLCTCRLRAPSGFHSKDINIISTFKSPALVH